MRVLPLQVLKGVQVPCRRVASLLPGDIEACHARVTVTHHKFGDFH